jgi:[protein-PII] uridylyltransferase
LLTRILPEWEPVRCKPQHNPYHRFTVDRHLVEAAVEASALRDRVTRPDLLLLGAWLHDLGKGYPGDHSDASADLMHDISIRMGFSAEDQHTLAKLTREHLLLPDAATRRDVRDPVTVAKVADVVEDMTTLELLHALTEADGKATGPSAWSSWKGALVDELVGAVAARLSGARSSTPRCRLSSTRPRAGCSCVRTAQPW